MSLCKYKHIFGQENTGIHSIKLFNIAIVDFIFTVLGAVLIAWYFKWNVLIVFAILMILGIIAHRLFCVNTTINKMIFGYIK